MNTSTTLNYSYLVTSTKYNFFFVPTGVKGPSADVEALHSLLQLRREVDVGQLGVAVILHHLPEPFGVLVQVVEIQLADPGMFGIFTKVLYVLVLRKQIERS